MNEIPKDEYYDLAIERIKQWREAVTPEIEAYTLMVISEDDDLLVTERLIQLAIKGLENDQT